MNAKFDVLIFTCEAREHLLTKAWESYTQVLGPLHHRRILAIDGSVDHRVIDLIQPDIVVQNVQRRGYVSSILNSLALVNSEYFVWLEDDWIFNDAVMIHDAVAVLDHNPSWVQVRWSKEAPLTAADVVLAPGVHCSADGFSANPSVCRTEMLREGFKFLQEVPKGSSFGVDGFENVLTRWSRTQRRVCAVFNPGNKPAVSHIGSLESTGRQWHMTASLETVPKEHLPNAGAPPALWRRFWMVWKLTRAFASVGSRQFFSEAAYDLAFRIMATEKTLSDEGSGRGDRTTS